MSEECLVDCPTCGELVASGRICEECGAEMNDVQEADVPKGDPNLTQVPVENLREEKDPKTEGVAVDVPDLAEVEAAKTLLNEAKDDLPTAAEAFDLPPVAGVAPEAMSVESNEDDFEDDCPHFRLEFNDATVFVQGWTTSYNFRLVPISPDSAQCKMLRVEVRVAGQAPKVETVWGMRGRRATTVDVNFCPQSLGFDISSEVRLTYQLNGQAHSYVANFKWDCVTSEESNKVIENLVIKMENVEAGMAADQNINILKDFKTRENQSLSSRLQDLKLRPIWESLELYDTSEGSTPVPEGLVDRLTLVGPGETRLHLLGGEHFSMGRSSDLDIITMLFKVPNCPDNKLTGGNGVSRYQAHLVFRAGRWEIRDGGMDPKASLARVKPSTYGTYLDGEKISGSGSLMTSNGSSTITLGRPNSREKNVFGFEVSVFNDPDHDKPSAVLLERTDKVSESFLCICGKVDFGDIFPNIAGGTLRFRKGGFKHTSMAGEVWLKPGSSFGYGWTCEAYTQAGF